MKKILIIGNITEYSTLSKCARAIIRDMQRFALVKCINISRTGLEAPEAAYSFIDSLVSEIKNFDAYLVILDPLSVYPDNMISAVIPIEFMQLPYWINMFSECKLLLTFNSIAADVLKNYNPNTYRYIPQIFTRTKEQPTRGPYKFYTILTEDTPRNHMLESIAAYLWEFNQYDKVMYNIFAYPGTKQKIQQMINDIVHSTILNKKNSLPYINISDNPISDREEEFIHLLNDCYVGIQYGTALDIHLYAALKIGNAAIYNDTFTNKEYFASIYPEGVIKSFIDIGLHAGTPNSYYTEHTVEHVTPLIDIANRMKEFYTSDIRTNSISIDYWYKIDNTNEIVNIL